MLLDTRALFISVIFSDVLSFCQVLWKQVWGSFALSAIVYLLLLRLILHSKNAVRVQFPAEHGDSESGRSSIPTSPVLVWMSTVLVCGRVSLLGDAR